MTISWPSGVSAIDVSVWFLWFYGGETKNSRLSALYLRNKILKVYILYTVYNVENQRIAINYTTFPGCMLPNLD